MIDCRTTIAVLITCHNRRSLTVASVGALAGAADSSQIDLQLFLVDDNSVDGSADAVRAIRPDATIIQGSGNLYWNGGMRVAWLKALEAKPDLYLWLNDDLALAPDSIDRLVELWRNKCELASDRLIVVGRTVSPDTGLTTYGGYVRARRLTRLNFRRRQDGDPVSCDTMNGNCVLIPARAVDDVGINSPAFVHGMGDIDYGLRARAKGYTILEHPTPVGEQEANTAWAACVSHLTIRNWRRILFHPKGLPWRDRLHFCRSHGGPQWPLNFVWHYLKILRIW